MGLFGKVKRKLEDAAMSKILAMGVKMLAEGRFGKGPAAAYWWLAGKKTWIAVALAGIYGVLYEASGRGLCQPCAEWSDWILNASGVLVAVGLFDAAVRIEPPRKVEP